MTELEDYEMVDEHIEAEATGVVVGKNRRQRLPVSLLEDYALRETVVDMAVSQGEVSFIVADVPVDSQGRFRIPAKKADFHGLEVCEPMDLVIDRVGFRA